LKSLVAIFLISYAAASAQVSAESWCRSLCPEGEICGKGMGNSEKKANLDANNEISKGIASSISSITSDILSVEDKDGSLTELSQFVENMAVESSLKNMEATKLHRIYKENGSFISERYICKSAAAKPYLLRLEHLKDSLKISVQKISKETCQSIVEVYKQIRIWEGIAENLGQMNKALQKEYNNFYEKTKKECGQALAIAKKPKVAVGAIGDEPKSGVLKGLSSQLTKALVKDDRYTAVDRSEDVLKKLSKEHAYQRSGAVNKTQIKEMGKQFGVQYMCIVESSEVMGSFMLEAKLMDVETAEIKGMGSTPSDLVNIGDLVAASEELSQQLLGGKKNSKTGSQQTDYGSGIFLDNDATKKAKPIASRLVKTLKQKVSFSEGTCISGVKAAIESDSEPSCSEGMVGIACKANVQLVITQCKGNKKTTLKNSIIGTDKYTEDAAIKQMFRRMENAEFWNEWVKELEKRSKQ
jgi:hypothetical protein